MPVRLSTDGEPQEPQEEQAEGLPPGPRPSVDLPRQTTRFDPAKIEMIERYNGELDPASRQALTEEPVRVATVTRVPLPPLSPPHQPGLQQPPPGAPAASFRTQETGNGFVKGGEDEDSRGPPALSELDTSTIPKVMDTTGGPSIGATHQHLHQAPRGAAPYAEEQWEEISYVQPTQPREGDEPPAYTQRARRGVYKATILPGRLLVLLSTLVILAAAIEFIMVLTDTAGGGGSSSTPLDYPVAPAWYRTLVDLSSAAILISGGLSISAVVRHKLVASKGSILACAAGILLLLPASIAFTADFNSTKDEILEAHGCDPGARHPEWNEDQCDSFLTIGDSYTASWATHTLVYLVYSISLGWFHYHLSKEGRYAAIPAVDTSRSAASASNSSRI